MSILKPTAFWVFVVACFLPGQVSLAQTPVINEVSKLSASEGLVRDALGSSLDIDGDVLIVGAPGNEGRGYASGAAFVFVRDGQRDWSEQAKLIASDTVRGNRFGLSVAIQGDTIVIGAPNKLTSLGRSGTAYVFLRDENGDWVESTQLLPSDGMTGDQYGVSVAIDEDTVIVGSRYDTETPGVYPPGSGAAYVFIRDPSGNWTEQAKLRASDTTERLFEFGASVDLHGDMAIVGAPGFDSQAGSAYIFARDPMGNWTEQAKLSDSEGEPDALFGYSVSIHGHTALVGAPLKGDWSGAAYLFTRKHAGWLEQAKLVASDGDAEDLFGWSTALADNSAVVGAFGHQANGDRAGAVYAFRRNGESWPEFKKLLASDGDRRDRLGHSIAIDGELVVAGAPGDEVEGNLDVSPWDNKGSAYIFDLAATVVEVNDLVSFEPDLSTYAFSSNTGGCPSGFVGKFSFNAQLGNVSKSPLQGLYSRVTQLSNGNLLLTTTGGAVGAGAMLPVPRSGGYSNGLLAPGDYVDVPFTMCLKSLKRFRFYVDVLAERVLVTGEWRQTGSMVDGRAAPITLLEDGKVLFVGSGQAQIYDPATGMFAYAGEAPEGNPVALSDGRVLFASVSGSSIYDPETGASRAIGPMNRPHATATLLRDGRVLFAGGEAWQPECEIFASAEMFDPVTETFTLTGSMSNPRSGHTATLLNDGTVLIVGGHDTVLCDFGPSLPTLNSAELFDPKTGTFEKTGAMPDSGVFYNTANLLPDGNVLIIAGTEGWEGQKNYIYDVTNRSFSEAGDMAAYRADHRTVSLRSTQICDGPVMVVGGSRGFSILSSAELYDSKLDRFYSAADIPEARAGGSATLLADGRVLVTGGYYRDHERLRLDTAWLFEPTGGCP